MKYIYIDAIGGASGDMLLGAFLDGLVPLEHFEKTLAKLKLAGCRIEVRNTHRHQIGAKKFTVHSSYHAHRALPDIIELIERSDLKDSIRQQTISVFRKLGEQEARIHQVPIEKVHFHEVGGVDSIVDIAGTFICLDYLQPGKILTSPLPVSRGLVQSSHGTLPVPAPATLALLQDYPLRYQSIQEELVTPTGAALISSISDGQLTGYFNFTVSKIGYGAGSRTFKQLPNLLRIWTGQLSDSSGMENILQIETNIDDMNPEFYPHLQQLLFNAGALDAAIYPGIMKKGRPGSLISILADPSKLPHIRKILYEQSSTIGFRYFTVQREKLQREVKKIDSPWGKLKIKIVRYLDMEKWIPEYEECLRIANETGVELPIIYNQIQHYLWEQNPVQEK